MNRPPCIWETTSTRAHTHVTFTSWWPAKTFAAINSNRSGWKLWITHTQYDIHKASTIHVCIVLYVFISTLTRHLFLSLTHMHWLAWKWMRINLLWFATEYSAQQYQTKQNTFTRVQCEDCFRIEIYFSVLHLLKTICLFVLPSPLPLPLPLPLLLLFIFSFSLESIAI